MLEVVDEFLVLVSIVDGEFEFSFFGPEDDRLPFHAADHVEGSLGLAAQSYLQEVFLDAFLDGFAQLGGDFEVTIRRTETFNALVRAFVIIVSNPKPDAFTGRCEAFELSAGEKLLPNGFPEAFDFAQRHGVMRPGFEVMGAVLLHLGLEAGGAAPVDELPAIVGEHLFGRLIFAGGDPKHFQDILGGVAAEQVRANDEAGVVVHEADEVGVAAAQSEGEDVRLPHLIGGGALEEPRPDQVAPWLGRGLDETLPLEGLADCLRTGRQEKHSPEQLGDPFDAAGRFLFFEFEDLLPDGLRQLGPGPSDALALQSLLALESIAGHPLIDGGTAHAHLLSDHLLGETLLQVEFDRAQTVFKGARQILPRRCPPRGAGVLLLLLYRFILFHADTFYY